MSAQLKLLSWLIDNPGWQYGKDAADGSKTSDTLVYLRMEDLELLGFVQRRQDPAPAPGLLARTQFRALLRKDPREG